ncbi:MAG: type II toxin-antitoxin system HicA family toxin [Nitrosotalea sp.]
MPKKLSKSGQTSFVSIEEKSYRIHCDLKRLSPIQGKELIKILCNKFSLSNKTKRSHVTITNDTMYVTVPLKKIHIGLLGVILRDCSITREEFSKEVLMNSKIFQSE